MSEKELAVSGSDQIDASGSKLTEGKLSISEMKARHAQAESEGKSQAELKLGIEKAPLTTPEKLAELTPEKLVELTPFNWDIYEVPTTAEKFIAIFDTQTGALKKQFPETLASGIAWANESSLSLRYMVRDGGTETVRKLLNKASKDTVIVVRVKTETHDKRIVMTLQTLLARVEIAEKVWTEFEALEAFAKTTIASVPSPFVAEDIVKGVSKVKKEKNAGPEIDLSDIVL